MKKVDEKVSCENIFLTSDERKQKQNFNEKIIELINQLERNKIA